MAEYIERERIEKFFDGIYDCADLTFEPNDHCCAADGATNPWVWVIAFERTERPVSGE